MMDMSSLTDRMAAGEVVFLDGAVGSEILRRTDHWVRNEVEESPEVIREVHRDYIAAGADVITTNTFELTRHNFINFFHDLEHMRQIGLPGLEDRAAELATRAVAIALEARRESGAEERVAVAGSISPLNHPFRSDLAPETDEARREHGETAGILAEAGVDLILAETMNTLREARAALQAGREAGLPVWVSLIPNGHGETLGGDPLDEAARRLRDEGADAVLVNCAPREHIDRALEAIGRGADGRRGAYALIGRYAPPSWKMDFYPRFVDRHETPPDEYAGWVRRWAADGAQIVGGCCGTTPDHIRAAVSAVREEGGSDR